MNILKFLAIIVIAPMAAGMAVFHITYVMIFKNLRKKK